MRYRIFASCGSCFAPVKQIKGTVVNEITFISEEFTGTMNSQNFWDNLRTFAKSENAFIELVY